MDGYSGGRIKRIKIKNFMTYDNVEIYPKKGLNLIVGLNGSGKSSIMCAICLGLAGKPNFTGRASQLSDFIKHGHQEAEIEIELESGNKKNFVIHRKIKGDKCEWTLNNSSSNQNEVASAVKKFNIDTSNLCQFLPQEKVVEFSRMDKKQRLENMLQAIGEPHLFELFNDLKELYKNVSEVEQSVKKHLSNKNSAEEENERISDEVQKQESRVRLKQELEEMFKQKKIVIYQNIYEEVQKLKERKNNLNQRFNVLSRERNDATAREDSILSSYQELSKKYKDNTSLKKQILNKMSTNSNALQNFKEQVENAKIEYKNKLKEKEEQKKRLHDLKKIVEGLQKLLTEEMENQNGYKEDIKKNSEILSQVDHEISEFSANIEKVAAEKNQLDYQLQQLRNQLNLLRDEQNKKMADLQKRDKYTYQAACWLLQNRNRFKANVYLPIMLEINVKSADNSKYVENVIAFRDMIAFVCEDKGDCECLTDIFKKQQKLPVNIVMAPETSMSQYASPCLSREHKKCGLDCFIIDLFTAPEPIMRYLCACYNIHRIPVTTTTVPGSSIEFILQSYQVFFSENMRITGKRSRYGSRNLSVKKDFIVVQNLLVHSNDELQTEVETKCLDLEEKFEHKKSRFDMLKFELEAKEKDQSKLRSEIKASKDKLKNIDKIKSTFCQKQNFLSKMSKTIDEEEEKVKITKKILSINELRERVHGEMDMLVRDLMQMEKDVARSAIAMNIKSRDLKLTQAANEDIHEKVKAAQTGLENIKMLIKEKRQSGQGLLAEIKLMGEEYKKYVEGPTPTMINLSLDDVEQKINHIQAQLNLNEDNEPLIAEYNSRKKKIEAIQLQIDKFQGDVNSLKQEIKKKKKEWLDPLQRHIKNINKKFSHYFKELNCVGEISLDIPENSDDFTRYGLRINLKFHDEETALNELSQNRHSGGECSVAAIVFILSLQELTEVPFRCIDEINQGMDSVNERKIYQLIADSVADDRCSQYFLLTPKLLMDLEYPEDVAVHIIFNSPYLNMKLDVKKHLEIASE